ncbi:hypothetical protein VNO77_19306 [Canavalia gladiata]|uniref:Uncharacterized protein n=1 Tax=Canavalia gladiata TaxID=3824 RepID=A0AAN9LN42_CANGL
MIASDRPALSRMGTLFLLEHDMCCPVVEVPFVFTSWVLPEGQGRGRRGALSLLFFLHSGDRSALLNAAGFRVARSASSDGVDGDLPQGLGATMEATSSARREQSSQHGSGRVLHRGSGLITTSWFKSRGRSSVTDAAYLLLAKQQFMPTVGTDSISGEVLTRMVAVLIATDVRRRYISSSSFANRAEPGVV